MIIIEDLTIESEIPIKEVRSLRFKWCINEHAFLHVEGILDAKKEEMFLNKSFIKTKILITFKNNTLFYGVIEETKLRVAGGVFAIIIQAVSASCMLDQKKHYEMFQDSSMTYKRMMQQVIKNASGNIICTIGDSAIEKPLLCFEETVWQYAIRMASHMNSYVTPDVITGKPSFWFGLRNGVQIKDDSMEFKEISITKNLHKKGNDKISYCFASRESYQLGDQLTLDSCGNTIYKKEAYLERGELLFLYWLARADTLKSEMYYQEKITGLSLQGSITKVDKEKVYIKLDIDGKTGTYPFQWYPETGTGLYAMPELGAKVELYFTGADEREAIAIRCRDMGDSGTDMKKMELPDEAKIIMKNDAITLEKKDRLSLSDSRINLSGEGEIHILASGKVRVNARILEVIAEDDINYSTNM